MFDRILIANRGEIACRVARTARRLGIATVAVYSDADAGALHVRACDEAYAIGPAPARQSYLDMARIVEVARRSGAQAVHPGYGFLSENAEFAQAVAHAGLVFIGPPPRAIRAMGSKAESKRLMEAARVPLVPGYHGEDQHDARLAAECERIGYPVLVKASAGGGGKGMRVVASAAELAGALASARREAASAFGDDRLLVERYLERSRHVEIQVFADSHGGCLHLFERDCSVQRRHQKVLEEAPAPGMTDSRRAEMGAAAIAAARAVGYVGAGTVEFIVDAEGRFYFMEMNTRLQVEHPVTEMITGLDLVEWQLRVAAGERLPLGQDAVGIRGHAIEARIYAEDPEKGFLPSVGRIVHLRQPATGEDVRVDTGIRAGDSITQFYDPMIAKLVCQGDTREAALARLDRAFAAFEVVGVATNVEFLRRVVRNRAFAGGDVDTALIDRERESLFPPRPAVDDETVAIAAAAEVRELDRAYRDAAAAGTDRFSPWAAVDTWWNNTADHAVALEFVDGTRIIETRIVRRAGRAAGSAAAAFPGSAGGDDRAASAGERFDVEVAGRTIAVCVDEAIEPASVAADAALLARTRRLAVEVGTRSVAATVVATGEERVVFADGIATRLRLVDVLGHAGERDLDAGHLLAPMSGTVVSVLAAVGDRVERGQALVVVEAMKMEHTVVAAVDGIVEAVFCAERDQVSEGDELVSIAQPPSDGAADAGGEPAG